MGAIMDKREMTPLRRVGREEARVWAVAICGLLVFWLVLAPLFAPDKDAAGQADQWHASGGER